MKIKLSCFKRNYLLLIAISMIILLLLLGYRPTPLSVLHEELGKNITILQEIQVDGGNVYIVDTPEEFKTVFVEKCGLLWRSGRVTVFIVKEDIKSDSLKTVGYMNYHRAKHTPIQLLAFQNEDPDVAAIQITETNGSVHSQPASLDELVVFQWDHLAMTYKMEILALNEEGTPLYYYGYPKGTNIFMDSEYKWHPITE